MRDMNDFYVHDNCQTKVHICGYVFTIAELFNIAISGMTAEELAKHKDQDEL